MKGVRGLALALGVFAVMATPASASVGGSINGGGSANDMTRFGIGISSGTGHFECLMPAVMTVQATVTGIDSITSASAAFHGLAAVNLSKANPFDLPPGPMGKDIPFTTTVLAGGPGTGFVDLEILGQSFAGTLDHGQIKITP